MRASDADLNHQAAALRVSAAVAEVVASFNGQTSRKLWIAFSGGMDSHVLLHALSQVVAKGQLAALHVNHALHADSAAWSNHCGQVCEQLGVFLVSRTVAIEPTVGESLEAQARDARYQVFSDSIGPGELLCLAHHRDDQAETVLMRLIRGSGVPGLSGMPAWRGLGDGALCRPLLQLPRSDLLAYARLHGLQWLEDPSNRDSQFERNYLRHEILPSLTSRRSGVAGAIARSGQHLAEANVLLNRMAVRTLAECSGAAVNRLPLSLLLELDELERKNLLRHCISEVGAPLPNSRRLQSFLEALITHQTSSATALHWSGWSLRVYRGLVYLQQDRPEITAQVEAHARDWDGVGKLSLPGVGTLSFIEQNGALNWAKLQASGACLQVRFRTGGERILLNGMHRSVKKLMQQWLIPPWLRHQIPLLYLDDQLIAVVGHGLADDMRAQAGEPGSWPELSADNV